MAQTDPRGDWRTWQTPHFRVHALAPNASVALTAAAEAERAYSALSAELRTPRGKVDLVLYDNVDFPNGYANVFPTRRIAIYLSPPAGEIGLARYDEWLRLVITHELTHIFHLDRADGIWSAFQHLFGRGPLFFPNLYQPAWVGEGLATYYESRMTGGGRVRGAFHSQLLAAQAGDHRWPDPGDVNLSNSTWPGGLGPYAWGSRFFQWESSIHGDSVIPRFIDRTSGRLWPLAISRPLTQAGGDGLYPDWTGFRKSWEKNAAPDDQRSVILARGSRAEPHPRLSADGQQLVLVQSDGKEPERVVVREAGTGRTIASQRINGSAELSWQGKDVIIAQLDFTNPVEIRSKLYRWTPGGRMAVIGSVSRLTRPFDISAREVGAVKLGPATTTVVRVAGDSVEPIPAPEGDGWSHLAVSPDGSCVAAARHFHQKWDIVVWPVGAPSEVEMVTDDEALDDDPAWSTDGKTLLFTSERSGLPQIYGYDLATRRTWQVTDEPTGAREGDIAADGTIYFSTVFSDGYAVASRAPGKIDIADPAPPERPVVLQPSPVTAEATSYTPWNSLAPRYWLPLLHDVGAVGQFLGATTSGSDAVGRTTYAAGLAHATNSPRWEGFFTATYTRWSALSLDLSAQQYWGLGGRTSMSPVATGVVVSERDGVLTAGATIRQRRWHSDASMHLGGELTQDAFFVADSFNFRFANPSFVGGVASVSARYTHRQALSISEEDGLQFDGLYRHRWVADGVGWSNETRGMLRGFLGLSLPGFSRWVLAGKISGVFSAGPYARGFGLGGQYGSIYGVVPGMGFGSGRDFGLRGYPRDAARFTRVVTTAAELRVPLFLVGKGIWRLPLAIDKVSISMFGETGGGWWEMTGSRDIAQYRDVGAELVFDLGLNLDAPFRVRVGAAQALSSGLGVQQGAWRGYAVLGTSF